MIADKETLIRATGYKTNKKQIEFLRNHHKKFFINHRNEPIILYKDLFDDNTLTNHNANQQTEDQNKKSWQPTFT